MTNLGKWIKEKWKTQGALGERLGIAQGRVSKWVLGTEGISDDYQAKIRKLGYTGPWPREETKEASAPVDGIYLTKEEFAEWRGYWKAGTEKVLERLEDLARRIEAIEKRLP